MPRRSVIPPLTRPVLKRRYPDGLIMSWPEVDLLVAALRDASQMQAAIWAAGELHAAPWAAGDRPEPLELASRYALLGARLGLARDAARLSS